MKDFGCSIKRLTSVLMRPGAVVRADNGPSVAWEVWRGGTTGLLLRQSRKPGEDRFPLPEGRHYKSMG